MADHETKGTMNQAKGSIKENAGKVLGDDEMEAKGKGEKEAGKAEKNVGKVENAIKNK